uniref:ABC1 atypical kinase-like domain-containing protein n=1 Tax=Craspedostauros australis TaxID=1486917 RepID=A0A7R9ZPL8_9STRA
MPPNIPRIVDALMRVHGYQLLKDGCFNADPHGGNFLLLPDGRIGLIDYGATKQLTKEERLSSCLLFCALARGDEDMLFDLCEISGYESKYGRRDVLMKLIRFGYDSYGNDVLEGKNVQQFIDECKEQDPWEKVPDNFVMSQFMSIRLRSLALGMNHPVKCSQWWGPIAEQVLIDEGLPYESWDREQLLKYKPEMNYQEYKFA